MIGTALSTLTGVRIPVQIQGRGSGSTRGHWEGDTLVIVFTNLNALGWIDYSGNFYTENATLTERWRLADYNTIDYELTVDDPKTFTQPWKMNFPKRRQGSGRVGRPLPPRGGPSAGSRDRRAHIQRADSCLPPVKDAYANEVWEEACFEGNHQNLIGNATTSATSGSGA